MKPLAIDLCCGLGGWTHALLANGWDVIGYDIEHHKYGEDEYPGRLIIQDIRTLNGSEFAGKVSLITASPPCTEYSYMAMPWSRAKKIRKALRGEGEFPEGYKGSKTVEQLNELFNACKRIAKEARCPIIIENVRGAQEWVGRSIANFGSFHLWGDAPALMPIPCKIRKTPEGSWDNSFADTLKGQDFTRISGQQAEGGKSINIALTYAELKNQVGTTGYATRFGESQVSRMYSSKSKARKQASAEIAKIPPALADWIAKVFKPK
jgi:site-specific DNA-cytosine methylase